MFPRPRPRPTPALYSRHLPARPQLLSVLPDVLRIVEAHWGNALVTAPAMSLLRNLAADRSNSDKMLAAVPVCVGEPSCGAGSGVFVSLFLCARLSICGGLIRESIVGACLRSLHPVGFVHVWWAAWLN